MLQLYRLVPCWASKWRCRVLSLEYALPHMTHFGFDCCNCNTCTAYCVEVKDNCIHFYPYLHIIVSSHNSSTWNTCVIQQLPYAYPNQLFSKGLATHKQKPKPHIKSLMAIIYHTDIEQPCALLRLDDSCKYGCSTTRDTVRKMFLLAFSRQPQVSQPNKKL